MRKIIRILIVIILIIPAQVASIVCLSICVVTYLAAIAPICSSFIKFLSEDKYIRLEGKNDLKDGLSLIIYPIIAPYLYSYEFISGKKLKLNF